MQISNTTSPSFGSIQVALSKMNNSQRDISDKFYRAVKYSDDYITYADNDIDIYVLPSKDKKADVEIRFMDPYSGRFYRGENGKIIKHPLKYDYSDKFWDFTDNVIANFKKIATGAIKRPTANIHNVIMGKTEMAKLNPDKADDIMYEYTKELMEDCFYTQKEAENVAFEQYKNQYHINNKDADF